MGKDKLKRFAEIETFENVIQPSMDEVLNGFDLRSNWNKIHFKNNNPIVLELGCGKGEYTVGMAKMFPNKNFIGVDIKGSRMWKGAKTSIEEGINNTAFLRSKVDFIEKLFGEDEVSEIWLTFSDPQPKRPRKRLTSPLFIARYLQLLKPNGTINLKCDSDLLFEYTLEQIEEHKYAKQEETWDVYNEFVKRTDQTTKNLMNIRTFYEQKWLEEGKTIKYCRFTIS
jgi:tRNA (guanine-N7-)-methyltransferase